MTSHASRNRREAWARAFFAFCGAVPVGLSVGIAGLLLWRAMGAVSANAPLLAGLLARTALVSLLAALVALPLGIGAAIYLSELSSPRTRRLLKPMVEVLAWVPTVVLGWMAAAVVGPVLGSGLLTSGLIVGLCIAPTLATLSEDALAAVPAALREAALGLGATRLEMIRQVLLPAARPGLIAAFFLATARAVGETMVTTMAGYETVTRWLLTTDYPESTRYAAACILFFLTLGLATAARRRAAV